MISRGSLTNFRHQALWTKEEKHFSTNMSKHRHSASCTSSHFLLSTLDRIHTWWKWPSTKDDVPKNLQIRGEKWEPIRQPELTSGTPRDPPVPDCSSWLCQLASVCTLSTEPNKYVMSGRASKDSALCSVRRTPVDTFGMKRVKFLLQVAGNHGPYPCSLQQRGSKGGK